MTDASTESKPFVEPVLPLKGSVLFPGISLPIVITSAHGIAAVDAALARPEKSLAVVAIRTNAEDRPQITDGDLYEIGTRAVISRMNRLDGAINLSLNGLMRVQVQTFRSSDPYFLAETAPWVLPDDSSPETEALHRETLKLFSDIRRNVTTELGVPVAELIKNLQTPLYQTYLMAVILALGVDKEQALLAAKTRHEACTLMHSYMSYEYNVQKLREKIANQVAGDFEKEQREYFLRRHLNEIQKELGEVPGGNDEVKAIKKQLAKTDLPDKAHDEVEKQLKRLSRLSEISPEYQVIHSYIKQIIDLPWSKQTQDQLDLDRAQAILDEDHYDLKEVKQRIIEHLAVLKLNPEAKGPILCFVGPPGTGKTSLGQSIARALGRKFSRMSLGGMHDEAELRGHRRTYVGAMPGRIIESIRRTGVNNPLIMLDEVDKLGVDFRGDPAAALMEILDPAQNFEFHDNYLDIPFDLSHVFFITTANTTDNIPKPLLDRMEMLRLAGYTDYEKVEIAKRFLIPREAQQNGISVDQLQLPGQLIATIIREYTREAGVRELQRVISRIARFIAVRQARGNDRELVYTPELVREILGPKQIFLEQLRTKWGPGISTGLAWTDSGGDIIYIETSLLPKRQNELKITGHLGEIMRESIGCAISYIWAHPEFHSDREDLRDSGLHIHIPAGAIPKDGPSAGAAIAVALASLYTNQPARKDLAMTGELTLSGLILPVGGIKEKVLAAHRAGIQEVILPRANDRDLRELPDQVLSEIHFCFVEDINQVLRESLPALFNYDRSNADHEPSSLGWH